MVFIHHKDCLKESLLKNNDCLKESLLKNNDSFFLKKKRKRRCPEAARCRFFAAVSATVTGVSRRLQLEKEKQAARDTSEHLITCDRKMFRSTFGFLETPQDENRCLHNK